MKKMKVQVSKISIVSLLLGVAGLYSEPLWAAVEGNPSSPPVTCQPQALDFELMKGRAQRLLFPDGREIIIVGHIHGYRQIHHIKDQIGFLNVEKMSDSQFESYLRWIQDQNISIESIPSEESTESAPVADSSETHPLLNPMPGAFSRVLREVHLNAKHETAMDHQLANLQFLKNILNSSSRAQSSLHFVGSEVSVEKFETRRLSFNENAAFLEKEYQRRLKKGHLSISPVEFEKILVSGSMAEYYYFYKNRIDDKHSEFIGTESLADGLLMASAREDSVLDEAISAYASMIDDRLLTLSLEENKAARQSWTLRHFLSQLNEVISDVRDVNVYTEDQFHQSWASLGRIPNLLSGPQLDSLKTALMDMVKTLHQRDLIVATNLLVRHQSGVHFIGIHHLEDLVLILRQRCLEESKPTNQ